MKLNRTIKIPIIAKGQLLYILVDEEDFPKVYPYRWKINKNGYVIATDEHKKLISLARYIIGFPEGKEVDHANRNKLDNRKENLRIADRRQNTINTVKNGRNKYRGVTKRSDNSYRVALSVNGKVLRIGGIRTEEEAARVYNSLAREHHGKFAILNEL